MASLTSLPMEVVEEVVARLDLPSTLAMATALPLAHSLLTSPTNWHTLVASCTFSPTSSSTSTYSSASSTTSSTSTTLEEVRREVVLLATFLRACPHSQHLQQVLLASICSSFPPMEGLRGRGD